MILDQMSNLSRYYGTFPALDEAIRYVQSTDLAALPLGSTKSGSLTINHFAYETSPEKPPVLEAHRCHLDLHILLKGHESIALAQMAEMKEVSYNPEEDCADFHGEALFYAPLTEGSFLLIYPSEAHMPKLQWEHPEAINKIVVKIPV